MTMPTSDSRRVWPRSEQRQSSIRGRPRSRKQALGVTNASLVEGGRDGTDNGTYASRPRGVTRIHRRIRDLRGAEVKEKSVTRASEMRCRRLGFLLGGSITDAH
jgi:hypothetical protein